MRTSRVSRETNRMVSALAASPRRSTRISSFSNYLHDGDGVKSEEIEQDGTSRDFSTKKRKRGADTPVDHLVSYKREAETVENLPAAVVKPKKARRQPAKRIKNEAGEISVEPPTNWERVYKLTKQMRSPGGAAYPAVVDTMGCEQLADRVATPEDQRLQTLIALMLSSQTKDTVTAAAIKNLQENLPGGLTLQSLLDVEPAELNSLIVKVGFHNIKTTSIKKTAIMLRDQFNGDIPDTIEGLVSLVGVGPKMAYLTMSTAWGRDEGIGVDVHVHRITNLWNWHKTKNPEETRIMLQSWLPKELWHEINWLLVGFGQKVCLPVGRKCGECVLAEEGLCPSSVVKRRIKKEIKEEMLEGPGGTEIKSEVKVKEEDVTVDAIGDIEDGGVPVVSPRRSRR